MARFHSISLEEFRDLFKIEKGWREKTVGNELVFIYPLKARPEIEVRVFSGVRASSQQSRDCGRDAVRTFAFNTTTNKPLTHSIKNYRTTNWSENIKESVNKIISELKARK